MQSDGKYSDRKAQLGQWPFVAEALTVTVRVQLVNHDDFGLALHRLKLELSVCCLSPRLYHPIDESHLQALLFCGAFLLTRDNLLTVVGGVKGDRSHLAIYSPLGNNFLHPHGSRPDYCVNPVHYTMIE